MYKKVVVLGGGKGISSLLQGLKDFPVEITAIISVSDNGKSTGKLRREFGTPAVGDLRRVISNLSSIDPIIKDMLEYRFHTTRNGEKIDPMPSGDYRFQEHDQIVVIGKSEDVFRLSARTTSS